MPDQCHNVLYKKEAFPKALLNRIKPYDRACETRTILFKVCLFFLTDFAVD